MGARMSTQYAPHLLWTDLETTGLDPEDHIIEAAFILTDARLNEVARYSTLVRPRPSTFARLMSAPSPVYEMHFSSGLIEELSEADPEGLPTLAEIDETVRGLLRAHVPEGSTVHIAGGGVAQFDQSRVREHMPQTARMLHYRPIDISVMATGYVIASGDAVTLAKSGAKAHRALADIEEDLEIARRAWALMSRMSGEPATGRIPAGDVERIVRAVSLADGLDRRDFEDVQRILDEQSAQDTLSGLSTVAAHLARELAASRGTSLRAVLDEIRLIAAGIGS